MNAQSAPDHFPGAKSASEKSQPFPLRVRIVQVIFLIIAVLATLGLAYWQWSRFTSAQGDFQNLGYALQWPVFGGFLVVAYMKYIQYERERLEGDEQAAVPKKVRASMREIPEGFIDLPGRHTNAESSHTSLSDARRKGDRDISLPGMASEKQPRKQQGDNNE